MVAHILKKSSITSFSHKITPKSLEVGVKLLLRWDLVVDILNWDAWTLSSSNKHAFDIAAFEASWAMAL